MEKMVPAISTISTISTILTLEKCTYPGFSGFLLSHPRGRVRFFVHISVMSFSRNGKNGPSHFDNLDHLGHFGHFDRKKVYIHRLFGVLAIVSLG